MSAAYRHCVNGLLTSIVWTLTGRMYDVYITDIVYLLDVLVVIVYMSYCNCWDYLLLHEDWGECSEDWAGACRWGGGEDGIFNWNFFSLRNVPGVLKRKKYFFPNKFFGGGGGGNFGVFGAPHAPTGGSRGVGKQYTLPMTCDWLKFWSGPAWRSKVIIRKPWRRKKKIKIKKFWQNHKAFPAGSRECLIIDIGTAAWSTARRTLDLSQIYFRGHIKYSNHAMYGTRNCICLLLLCYVRQFTCIVKYGWSMIETKII